MGLVFVFVTFDFPTFQAFFYKNLGNDSEQAGKTRPHILHFELTSSNWVKWSITGMLDKYSNPTIFSISTPVDIIQKCYSLLLESGNQI